MTWKNGQEMVVIEIVVLSSSSSSSSSSDSSNNSSSSSLCNPKVVHTCACAQMSVALMEHLVKSYMLLIHLIQHYNLSPSYTLTWTEAGPVHLSNHPGTPTQARAHLKSPRLPRPCMASMDSQ